MESNPGPVLAAHESFAAYQREAHKTAGSMPPRDRVFMASMGLAGEAGEVVDELKKVHFHDKPYDRDKLLRELGDVLWYLAELATAHELSLQDVAHANLEKLRKRHGGETFKPHAEQDRSPESCAREFDNTKAPLPALPVHGSCILDSVDVHGEPILPRFNIAPTRRPSAVRTFEQGPQCGACGSDSTRSSEPRGGNFHIVCQDCKAEWLVRPSVEDHPENCNCELCR